MRKPSIAIKLNVRNYSGLVNLANRVVSSLTGNLAFPAPVPALALAQTQVTAVDSGISAWGPKGNRGAHATLTQLRQDALTLSQMLKSLSQYVQNTAQTTAGSDYSEMGTLIVSSGFQLAGDKTPQGILQMVQNLHVFVSRKVNPNQVRLKWRKPLNTTSAGNVKSYRVLRGSTSVLSAAVEISTVTKTSFTDTNSTATPVNWFYWIIPVNTAGDGVVSDVVAVTIPNA